MGLGGGGGGGTSGAVSYPGYMEEIHEDWLRQTDDTIDLSITDVMNSAFGNSPFTTLTAYDPTTEVGNIISAPNGLETLVNLLSSGTTLDTLISKVLDESRIEDSVASFSADLSARADAEIYPRFEAGMRDINAVMSSAFVVGRSLIADQITREVAKYENNLRYKAWGDDAIRVIGMKLEYEKAVAQLLIDSNRISIVAKKEEADANAKLDEADATWDLEVFQYGANLLASVSGGTAPHQKGPSTFQSMLGGGLSGAAAGAVIGKGNPLAIGAGAAIGIAGALFGG